MPDTRGSETEMAISTRLLSLMYDKATPRLRVDELNENSTRYDLAVAAPPDETLVDYWYAWAIITFLSGMFSFVVFLGVVSSRKTRRQPFNLYLIYLMVPDFLFSLLCAMTCLMNAIHGSYWSHWMCNFQQFYVVFGFGANMWLNGVVCFQLHRMLSFSNGRRRYQMPSRRRVTFHSMAVYSWCLFLASWGIYETPKFPFHSGAVTGLGCLPVETDGASTLFFWLVFFPVFAGIPLVYVMWACFDVYRRNLLPPRGKRRLLFIYYARLVGMFVVMWVPSIVLAFVMPISPEYFFAGGTWSHLQGGVSAVVALMKPDILQAVKRFIKCRCDDAEVEKDERFRQQSEDSHGKSLTDAERMRRTSTSMRVSEYDSHYNKSLGDMSFDLEIGPSVGTNKSTELETTPHKEEQTKPEQEGKEDTPSMDTSDGIDGVSRHSRIDQTGQVTIHGSRKNGRRYANEIVIE
ncbi:unnamed protein product [Cylindrotheca closterium]|uniref:G-protein coupled receptors family 1 profile domain-containing protein n=1 Tax=Cylindrotheca closterium TaxID=2856 RepID=A0AAD2FNF4_9STRA|nr:unnamed protein product [Cylindrotheca closterium]